MKEEMKVDEIEFEQNSISFVFENCSFYIYNFQIGDSKYSFCISEDEGPKPFKNYTLYGIFYGGLSTKTIPHITTKDILLKDIHAKTLESAEVTAFEKVWDSIVVSSTGIISVEHPVNRRKMLGNGHIKVLYGHDPVEQISMF